MSGLDLLIKNFSLILRFMAKWIGVGDVAPAGAVSVDTAAEGEGNTAAARLPPCFLAARTVHLVRCTSCKVGDSNSRMHVNTPLGTWLIWRVREKPVGGVHSKDWVKSSSLLDARASNVVFVYLLLSFHAG